MKSNRACQNFELLFDISRFLGIDSIGEIVLNPYPAGYIYVLHFTQFISNQFAEFQL